MLDANIRALLAARLGQMYKPSAGIWARSAPLHGRQVQPELPCALAGGCRGPDRPGRKS